MSLIKKISSVVLVAMLFSVALITFAQTANTKNTSNYGAPEIYIKDLVLNKKSYQAGETVQGSFVIGNAGISSVSDIHYEIRLADKYQENGLAGDFYDYKSFGPLYFTVGESQKISFGYVLPKSITGTGLGIQVRAVLGTGGSLSWADSKIIVTGVNSFLNIDTAEIVSNGKLFRVQAGPTLKEGKEAYLQFEIKNPNKTAVTYVPNIKIYERATNKLLSNINLATSSVSVDGSKMVKYDLPRFASTTGVFIGKVSVNDISGSLVAPAFDFRYIISGPLVTINNLVVDSLSAELGQTINGILSYTGAAPDIENPEGEATAQNYNLNIKIFSQDNVLVGEYNDTVDFNKGVSKNFSVTSLIKAEDLRSEVVIKDGDKIITTYSSSFPSEKENTTYFIGTDIILMALLIISLFILLLLLIKFSRIKKPVFILTIVLLILFWTMVFFRMVLAGAYGGVTYIAPWPLAPTIAVSVNSTAGWNLTAGQSYRIYGSVWSSACGNETVTTYVYVDGAAVGSGVGGQFCTDSCTRAVNFDYASWVKYAPINGGNFCNGVKAETYQGSKLAARWEGGGCGTATVPTPTTPVLVAATGSCGGKINLSWNNTANATGYSIYRGGSLILSTTSLSMIDSGLATNTSYSYSIVATNGSNRSATSSVVTAQSSLPCAPLTVACSVVPPSTTMVDQPVIWRSIPTGGSEPYVYSWMGTDGLSGNTVTVIKSYSTTGQKYATTTVVSGAETVSIGCPLSVASRGGPGAGGGGGVNITPKAPIAGICGGASGSVFANASELTNSPVRCYLTGSVSTPATFTGFGPWSWTCSGVNGSAVSSPDCTAYQVEVTNTAYDCNTLTANRTSPVNVNNNIKWTATPKVAGNYATKWAFTDSNNPTQVYITASNPWDKIFTTTGLKTVYVKFASSTAPNVVGNPCTATTTVVQTGGGINEI